MAGYAFANPPYALLLEIGEVDAVLNASRDALDEIYRKHEAN